MTHTYVLDGLDELQDVVESVVEDFRDLDFVPLLTEELGHIADLHTGFFRDQVSPTGTPWPANEPITIRRKGHSRILRGHPRNNYRLSKSLTSQAKQSTGDAIREVVHSDTGAYLSFGTAVEYSRRHDGPQRYGRKVKDYTHVGLTEKYVDSAAERTIDYAIRKLAE